MTQPDLEWTQTDLTRPDDPDAPRSRRPLSPYRREVGQYLPRRFTDLTRDRFLRDRCLRYTREISGLPNYEQAVRIDSMARLEFAALRAESAGTMQGDREAREHRRLLDRLLADHRRSVAASQPEKPKKPIPDWLK